MPSATLSAQPSGIGCAAFYLRAIGATRRYPPAGARPVKVSVTATVARAPRPACARRRLCFGVVSCFHLSIQAASASFQGNGSTGDQGKDLTQRRPMVFSAWDGV